MSKLSVHRPNVPAAEWAFRYLQTLPEVKVILSGMSNFDQLKANIETFKSAQPLSTSELATLDEIVKGMLSKKTLPCTACNYCVSHCPKNLMIPELISLYNEHTFTEGGFLAPMALMAFDADKKPDACIACKKCESVCPQQIKISEAMADFTEKLNAMAF